MAGWGREPTLDELLRDGILRLLMRRDGVEEKTLRELAARTAALTRAGAAATPAARTPVPCDC